MNVLCEGPSILGFAPEDLLIGPTIAINRAIALRTAPVDFWATTDNPHHLWEWSLPHRPERLRYFTTDQNLAVWHKLLGADGIRRVYTAEMTDMGLESDTGLPMTLPTLMPVCAWLLRLGCKRVRLFGCDMRGSGSPMSGDWAASEDRNWGSRWRAERVLLSHVFHLYRAHGARIERWAPRRK